MDNFCGKTSEINENGLVDVWCILFEYEHCIDMKFIERTWEFVGSLAEALLARHAILRSEERLRDEEGGREGGRLGNSLGKFN